MAVFLENCGIDRDDLANGQSIRFEGHKGRIAGRPNVKVNPWDFSLKPNTHVKGGM
jgi:hypothetical protein